MKILCAVAVFVAALNMAAASTTAPAPKVHAVESLKIVVAQNAILPAPVMQLAFRTVPPVIKTPAVVGIVTPAFEQKAAPEVQKPMPVVQSPFEPKKH